jgi:CDP-glycerol glycerophosphotransferase
MADEIITENTLKFKYVCSCAKYIVSPMGFPNKGRKRKGQILVQTFHGSFTKKVYLGRDKNNKKFQRFTKMFKNTDIICTQCPTFIPMWIESYGLPENVKCSHGSPRNDVLFQKKDDKEFKENLKKELGLPLDKKIILYCPTWRRYDYKAILPFDIEYLRKELSDEYVLLMRSHVGKHTWVDNNLKPVEIYDNKFCFNGCNYVETTHLYLIADMMISDYSSAIWDFAITKKPQILYIYDFDKFKEEFKLHFDYKETFPFPQPRNQEELVQSIKNYSCSEVAYEALLDKFLCYETGSATKELVDMMLNV